MSELHVFNTSYALRKGNQRFYQVNSVSAQEAANGKEVDADVREIAYCLAVARGGETAYEAMLSLYLSVRCRCQSPCGVHSLFACVSANVTDILTIRGLM